MWGLWIYEDNEDNGHVGTTDKWGRWTREDNGHFPKMEKWVQWISEDKWHVRKMDAWGERTRGVNGHVRTMEISQTAMSHYVLIKSLCVQMSPHRHDSLWRWLLLPTFPSVTPKARVTLPPAYTVPAQYHGVSNRMGDDVHCDTVIHSIV